MKRPPCARVILDGGSMSDLIDEVRRLERSVGLPESTDYNGEKSTTKVVAKVVCNNESNDKNKNRNKEKLMELPLINANVFGEKFECLLDSGASNSVISEQLFMQLRYRYPKLQVLPTCGLFCKSAISSKKQRIRGQVMLPIEIDGQVYDIIFLIIPNLNANVIIGCESFLNWEAILNFQEKNLVIHRVGKAQLVPFITTEREVLEKGREQENELLGETFFVESVELEGREVVTLNKYNEAEYHCETSGFCESCGDMINIVGTGDSTWTRDDVQVNEVLLEQDNELMSVLKEKVDEIEGIDRCKRDTLYNILIENKELFADKLGKCTSYTHSFKVKDFTPFTHKSRPIPAQLGEKVDQAIEKMVSDEVLELSDSQYLNPLCVVMKADNTVIITVDARVLNSRCEPDYFHNRNIDQLLYKVAGSKYFTSIDLSAAFWQIPLAEEYRDMTAFLHNGKQYRFTRTPFGHCTSSAALLRALHHIFKNELDSYVACFTDDFLIHDSDLDLHLEHINTVLTRLREHGFTVKPKKTHFIKREAQFLGFIVSEDGLRPNPTKIEAIMDIPAPKNLKQLRRLLGVWQYQARFLINYAKEAEPLRKLLHKGMRWKWTAIEQNAFVKVKQLFAESVLLKRPDYTRPFVIYCDASYRGLGAVLTQQDVEGNFSVIATCSRGLTPPECRLFPTEIEICALYLALQKFRDYVFNHEVIIRSDAISLAFMQTCKLTSSRISRFVHEIMAHNVKIEYVKGATNIFADLLSRLPRNEELRNMIEMRERKECVVMRIGAGLGANVGPKLKNIVELQKLDPVLSILRRDAPMLGSEGNSKYALKDEILYKLDGRAKAVWKTYIPACLEEEIILMYHQGLGHSGVERVALTLQEHLYIKRLGNKARKVISKCVLCQKAKQMNVKYDVEPQAILRDQPRALVVTDVHGPLPVAQLGFRYIFVVADVFSKFVRIYPMKALNTTSCLKKILEDYIPRHGKMEAILSDNASIFASPRWREAFESRSIKVYHSSTYHPQSNPCERHIKEITTYMRIFCHANHRNWLKYCPVIEAIINRSPNPTTKFTPEFLFSGKQPPSLFHGMPQGIPVPTQDQVDECKLAYERVKKRAEKRKASAKRYKHKWLPKVGDKVLVRDHKLSSKLKHRYHRMELLFKGPFIITKILGEHSYELCYPANNKRLGVYHRQLLKPYRE